MANQFVSFYWIILMICLFFCLYRHIEYGAIFVCWFMHFPFIVVTDPEMVKVHVEQM